MDRNKYYRDYWKLNPEKYEIHKKNVRKYQKEHPKVTNKSNINWRFRLKIRILSHYSPHGTPECCNPFGEHKEPYTTTEALSVDHINDGGRKHFKEIGGSGTRFYLWLEKNNYPEGFQTLCMNCQFIKQHKKVI